MLYPLRLAFAFVLLALIALAFIPLTLLRPMHRNNMGDICIFITNFMAKYWGVTYEVEHPERLEPKEASVIISNHQDTEEMFFGESLMRRGTVALGKWELVYIPFIGWLFFLAGNILVKRQHKDKAQQALSKAAQKMKANNLSVLIFPEGTRNWGKPLPFKLGAFKLAIEAQAPIQPVICSLRPQTMDYNKLKSGTVKLKCLEPISTVGLTQDDAIDLAVRCRKLIESETIEVTKSTPGYDGSLG